MPGGLRVRLTVVSCWIAGCVPLVFDTIVASGSPRWSRTSNCIRHGQSSWTAMWLPFALPCQ